MSQVTLKIANFLSNPLLQRKQFVVKVFHPKTAPIDKLRIREQLAKVYKVNDLKRIVVGDFQTKFGGGVSTGFGRVYDTSAAALRFERNYRLARLGICDAQVRKVTRKSMKMNRTQRKKVRGTAKNKVSVAAK